MATKPKAEAKPAAPVKVIRKPAVLVTVTGGTVKADAFEDYQSALDAYKQVKIDAAAGKNTADLVQVLANTNARKSLSPAKLAKRMAEQAAAEKAAAAAAKAAEKEQE